MFLANVTGSYPLPLPRPLPRPFPTLTSSTTNLEWLEAIKQLNYGAHYVFKRMAINSRMRLSTHVPCVLCLT